MKENILQETPLAWAAAQPGSAMLPRVEVVSYCMDLTRAAGKWGTFISGEMIHALKAGLPVSVFLIGAAATAIQPKNRNEFEQKGTKATKRTSSRLGRIPPEGERFSRTITT